MTALEQKWDKIFAKDKNRIPPITDPMGKHWDQPEVSQIKVTDTHALMDSKSFSELLDYTWSQPSGVYPGKMWRAQSGPKDQRKWFLCWFGISSKGEDFCSNNYREIVIRVKA